MEPVTHVDKRLQVSEKGSSSRSTQKQMHVAGKHYQIRLVHLDPNHPVTDKSVDTITYQLQCAAGLFLRSSPGNHADARSARIEAELNARTIATEQINKAPLGHQPSKVIKFPSNSDAAHSVETPNNDNIRRNAMAKISELPMAQRDLAQRILNTITHLQRERKLSNKGIKRVWELLNRILDQDDHKCGIELKKMLLALEKKTAAKAV